MKDFLNVKKGKGVYATYDRVVYSTGLLIVDSFLKYASARLSIESISSTIGEENCSVEAAELLSLIVSAVAKRNVSAEELLESTDSKLEKISKYMKERDENLSILDKHFGLNKETIEEFYNLWKEKYPKMTDGIGGSIVMTCSNGLITGLFVYLNNQATKEEYIAFCNKFADNPLIPKDIFHKVRKMVFLTARLLHEYVQSLIVKEVVSVVVKKEEGAEQANSQGLDGLKIAVVTKCLFPIAKTYSEIEKLLGLTKHRLVSDFVKEVQKRASHLEADLDTENEQTKEEVVNDK